MTRTLNRVKFRTVSDNYDRYCPVMVTRKGNKGRRKSYYMQHNELLTEIILQIHWWLFTIDSWIVLPVRHLGQHTQLFLTWWKRIYRRKAWIWVFLSRLYGRKDFWKIFQNWLLLEKLLHGSITFDWSANQVLLVATEQTEIKLLWCISQVLVCNS